MGAFPINTATRTFRPQAIQDGLHVLELFGGVGLGVLRATLAAGYKVRCIRTQHLAEACARTESVRLSKEVGIDDLARREDAVARLVDTYPLALPNLHPSSTWLGDVVHGAVPINAAIRMLSP